MWTVYWKAAVLAVVEGATEFLPVSSTGHLILAEELLPLSADAGFNDAFIIMIQFPAILSVVLYFWRDLWPFQTEGEKRVALFRMWGKIAVAFSPAVVLGFLLNDVLERYLFAPGPVGVALLVGGLVLIVLERRPRAAPTVSVAQLSVRTAFLIGVFQCLAMIPGTSRSAATIVGGMLLGLSRAAAAEFSFFLAIPTLLAATVYTVAKRGLSFTGEQWAVIGVGSVVSFVVAYGVIAWFMAFVKRHSFEVFGWYRVVLAIVVFAALGLGWIGG